MAERFCIHDVSEHEACRECDAMDAERLRERDAELAELRERCARLERERDEAREELSLIESDTEWRASVWEALAAMKTELAVHPAQARDRCTSLEAALREHAEVWRPTERDPGCAGPDEWVCNYCEEVLGDGVEPDHGLHDDLCLYVKTRALLGPSPEGSPPPPSPEDSLEGTGSPEGSPPRIVATEDPYSGELVFRSEPPEGTGGSPEGSPAPKASALWAARDALCEEATKANGSLNGPGLWRAAVIVEDMAKASEPPEGFSHEQAQAQSEDTH